MIIRATDFGYDPHPIFLDENGSPVDIPPNGEKDNRILKWMVLAQTSKGTEFIKELAPGVFKTVESFRDATYFDLDYIKGEGGVIERLQQAYVEA